MIEQYTTSCRDVVRADAQPCGHPWPEPLEHDVRARAERAGEGRVPRRSQTTDSLPAPQRPVPGRSAPAHRVALGRLDAHHARAEPQQLAARVRAGEVAGELDDEDPCQRLRGVRHARLF